MASKIVGYVLQGNYNNEWEDITAEETNSEIFARLHDYEMNEPKIMFRVQREYQSGRRVTIY